MDMAPSTPQGGTLRWHDLEVVVRRRVLLHATSGVAWAGRLLGVLGPSGAGKSTLLAAIAGALPPCAAVRGRVAAEGSLAEVGVAEGTVALLEQHDPFFSELTVRETLRFAAELEGWPASAAAARADGLLGRVGLTPVAGRRVGRQRTDSGGGGGEPAVSSGERRRLAVACAIVGEGRGAGGAGPPRGLGPHRALLADEPTTGLDAFQASRVVGLLRELAVARRCPAVATLHQPRASIWGMLDDVLLVAPGGHVVFVGPRDDALSYFSSLGEAIPTAGVNPAEYVVDLVSVDAESSETASAGLARIGALARAFRSAAAAGSAPGCAAAGPPPARAPRGGRPERATRLGVWRALGLLVRRSLMQMARDRFTNVLRVLATAGLGVVFGAHFGVLDSGGLPSARSVASRICVVSFGTIAMAMLAMARALDRFAKEKAIVARERAGRCYSGGTYLVAKAITELPLDALCAALFAAVVHRLCALHAEPLRFAAAFAAVAVACSALGLAVGAAVPRPEQALTIGAPIMMTHMLTGVIDPAGATAAQPLLVMQALQLLSPIRHAIEALCVLELRGARLALSAADAPRMGGLALVRTGDEVLARLGIVSSFDACMRWLVALAYLHLLGAAVALILTRPRFARARMASEGATVVSMSGLNGAP